MAARGTTGFLSRHEHLGRVGSTNDVVRSWLEAGTPEVCLATADEQTAGRGRAGRSWIAPSGAALLASLGFRPTWLAPDRAWQLAAVASLAMAEAAEAIAQLPLGMIRLKWPNDLVVETDGTVRKLGGVLGETGGLGSADPRVTVGLGINVDWPADRFAPELAATMTSLRVLSGDRPVDRDPLTDAFLARLEPAVEALRHQGHFDADRWAARQVTTGRDIRLEQATGAMTVRALGVDPAGGALLVEDPARPGEVRAVLVGEIEHVRLAPASTGAAPATVLV
jgi:BirA family biotin operon repressor/biotin-[acetyl-CoA-carboxylase] ligase